jgi:hypothetical protein
LAWTVKSVLTRGAEGVGFGKRPLFISTSARKEYLFEQLVAEVAARLRALIDEQAPVTGPGWGLQESRLGVHKVHARRGR